MGKILRTFMLAFDSENIFSYLLLQDGENRGSKIYVSDKQ